MFIDAQSFVKFPAVYGTGRFITVSRILGYLTLFWLCWIYPNLEIHLLLFSINFNIILPYLPNYTKGYLAIIFPIQYVHRYVCISHFVVGSTCPTHLIIDFYHSVLWLLHIIYLFVLQFSTSFNVVFTTMFQMFLVSKVKHPHSIDM